MFDKDIKIDRIPQKKIPLGGDPFFQYQPPISNDLAIEPLAPTHISPCPPTWPIEDSSKDNNGEILDGRYRLEEKLGEGGMGTVYRAKHTLMDKTLAIKVIHPELAHSDEIAKRFEREAKSASRLTDPHCINVTDFGRTQDGDLFLVMEYLEGETLAERLRKKGPLPLDKAVQIAGQILKALVHAHGAGVVHRDLKPDNVMLVTHGETADFVKVFDFGVAKLLTKGNGDDVDKTSNFRVAKGVTTKDEDENLTQAGLVLGTPAYLSPEQGRGRAIDHRADLYAVGVILFEMLAGFRPFRGSSALDVVLAHLNEPIPTLPRSCTAPKGIHAAIKKSLAKNPEDRFESAEQFIAALEGINSSSSQFRLYPMLVERLVYPVRRASAQFISKRFHRIPTSIRQILEQLEVSSPNHISQSLKGGLFRQTLPSKRHLLIGALALSLILGLFVMAIWKMQDNQFFNTSNSARILNLGEDSNEDLARLVESAQSYLQAGDGKRASSAARRALRMSPDHASSHLLLGHALYLRGDRLGATKSYAEALDLDRSLVSDTLLQEHLGEALSHDKSRRNAASALAEFAGKKGIEILVSRANSNLASGEERAAARQALIDTHNEESIDWVASLGADYYHYDSCSKKREIIAQMAETGDLGFVTFLENELGRLTKVQAGLPSDDSSPRMAKSREDKPAQCLIQGDISRAYRILKGTKSNSPE